MDFSVPSYLIYVGSWLTLTAGVWKLFDQIETVASSTTKKQVANWLNRAKVEEQVGNWAEQFCEFFDRLFGEHHFSFRRFFRSSIASFFSLCIITLIYLAIKPNDFSGLMRNYKSPFEPICLVFGIFALINLFPDYVSLIETRIIIGLMKKYNSNYVIFGLLVLDAVITVSILCLAFSMLHVLFLHRIDVQDIFEQIRLGFAFESVIFPPSLGLFIYTTFFTSVWVWLYLVSAFVIRTFTSLRARIGKTVGLLDISNKPFKSLAVIANILITLVYCTVPLLRLIS